MAINGGDHLPTCLGREGFFEATASGGLAECRVAADRAGE
jgi:hypothetical protein